MKNILAIYAHDVMDQVYYSARIKQYDSYEQDSGEVVLAQVGTFPGDGQDDVVQWLRDVLVALLEDL